MKEYICRLIITLLLTGCSTGALTMYQAQETANVGNQVISETKNYFSELTNLQIERAAVILAAQPNCRVSSNWKITVRKSESSTKDNPLCVTAEDRQRGNITQIDLMPLNKKCLIKTLRFCRYSQTIWMC